MDRLNVKISMRLNRYKHLTGIEAIASLRMTPWGRIVCSRVHPIARTARRLAQAAVLEELARAMRASLPPQSEKVAFEPCAPGCAGWFMNEETGRVERCDDCARFPDDESAAAFAGVEQRDNRGDLDPVEDAAAAAICGVGPDPAIEGSDECVTCGARFFARPSDKHPICRDCRRPK